VHFLQLVGEVTSIARHGDFRLQDGGSTVLVSPAEPLDIALGDWLTVNGVLERSKSGDAILARSRLVSRKPGSRKLRPALLTAEEIDMPRFAGTLVRMQGRVLSVETQNESKVILFEVYTWKVRAIPPASLQGHADRLSPGDQISVTGVAELSSDPITDNRNLIIYPRVSEDLQVLARAPWWLGFPWGKAMVLALFLIAVAGA
jgi:hypothetical protein